MLGQLFTALAITYVNYKQNCDSEIDLQKVIKQEFSVSIEVFQRLWKMIGRLQRTANYETV